MKEACGTAHMKAILSVGELGTMENVYKASMICMQAGSDFIKTSTGKEAVNATLPGAHYSNVYRALYNCYTSRLGHGPCHSRILEANWHQGWFQAGGRH